jgi:phosphate acetyltransferase
MTPQEFLDGIKARARNLQKHIVYPDALDERAIQAARIVTDESIAKITLIGSVNQIREKADALKISLSGIVIIDPQQSSQLDDFAQTFYELRKHKGVQLADAQLQLKNPLFFGAMMVRKGLADGSIAGSISTTGDVIRAGILCIGLQKGIDTVSSFFLMVFPDKILAFADCAVLPDPTPEQLADIAITTAINYQKLLQEESRVAMLSFSTKGSAEHPLVEKVQQATTLVRQKRPDLNIDGELQFDAAIIPSIGKKKAPDSKIAGSANVLIFPDLNAGNIGYKIAQRLGNAKAIGPIVQGLNKPAFDLSRGCSIDDIVAVTAFNAVMG